MALGPALYTRLIADGFRVPIPTGTSFRAGDIVIIGSTVASLVGGTTTASLIGFCQGFPVQAANDYNFATGSTSAPNSGNSVGLVVVPKSGTEAIAIGQKVAWSTTTYATTSTTGSLGVATGVVGTSTTPIILYSMGMCVVAATTANTLTTDSGVPGVTVLMWPGAGLGS